METLLIIKPRAYHDSVSLMAASQKLSQLAGIHQAVLVMGTEHNKTLLADSGLLTDAAQAAHPDDLIIAIQAEGAEVLEQAAATAEKLLSRKAGGGAGAAGGRPAPRSLRTGLEHMPDANLALISVPGAFAVREAQQALNSGLHVLLFSDNVDLKDEIALKQLARSRGLLCMGPDCGTAMLGGVGLGFANVVRRGSIGIVSASGTGAQEVAVLIDQFGGGVSHIIGTGGRDLKPEVGGLMMLAGIEMLAHDPATECILLISKPPDEGVARQVLGALQATGKRGVVCFLGFEGTLVDGVALASTLYDAAALAMGRAPGFDEPALAQQATRLSHSLSGQHHRLRGLFSGGTLATEAQLELGRMGVLDRSDLVDYGDDQFTRGRPHPMIDWTLRLAELRRVAAEPETGLLLLDVVLGYGSHPDPAPLLASALATIAQPAIVYVCGTDADPQSRSRQLATLAGAGAILTGSNREAARLAGMILKEAVL